LISFKIMRDNIQPLLAADYAVIPLLKNYLKACVSADARRANLPPAKNSLRLRASGHSEYLVRVVVAFFRLKAFNGGNLQCPVTGGSDRAAIYLQA
jgi:hypothetical protein